MGSSPTLPPNMNRIKKSTEERFWSKVDKRGPDECWEWSAAKTSDGYGRFKKNGGFGKKYCKAHRAAYELAIGDIPKGLEIDHICRNRACVNPKHLRAVTHKENTRAGLGTKLTKEDIPKIFRLRSQGHMQKEIARLFGVSRGAIGLILRGKTWVLSPTCIR